MMAADYKHRRPMSIPGIKSLAKTIKRAEGIQHARALDVAAKQAGYENFVHARRVLGDA
ncbi:hypothetical protein [Sphingomonas montanisoli]|uniref:hypothetical protein n=1 Tax=Sphingomonas montanisoli TaxID=2606412 RepID=UPI0015E1741F|nr:hypothetical protein [Sphingomonas montanisoli]